MTTPTISDVTGTVETGQIVTIAGAYLYDQDRTDLDLTAAKANMEGASAAADGYNGGGGSSYHGSLKIWKDGSVIGKRNTGPGQYTNGIWNNDWDQSAQTRYVRFMAYWDASVGDGSWPDNYMKVWYNAPYPTQQYPFDLKGKPSGAAPDSINWIDQNVTGNDISTASLPEAVQNGKWNSVILGLPQGSPHLFECWWNGVKIVDVEWSQSPQSDTNPWDTQLDTNSDACGAGLAIDTYFGMIEHSSSRLYDPTMVHIGNTSDFATASPKYQYLTQISDTENKIEVDLTGLGEGPYWMWVTNARNERSVAYSLSGDNPDRSDPARMFRSLITPRRSIFTFE